LCPQNGLSQTNICAGGAKAFNPCFKFMPEAVENNDFIAGFMRKTVFKYRTLSAPSKQVDAFCSVSGL
jgi:hypothetical protein